MILLLACHPDIHDVDLGATPFEACAVDGGAHAAVLSEQPLFGDDALGGPGDAVLVNDRAAFVISDPQNPKTYYSYGGIPIDAVALDGCAQAVPERFGEMGFVLGQLDIGDFEASQLRMFRGDAIEVVAEGSASEPAIVDVHGTDDRFWLIELELMRRQLADGTPKYLGDPWDLDVTVRYTLAPGASALTADVTLESDAPDGFLVGTVLFPSDHADEIAGRTGDISIGGFTLDSGVPWFVSAAAAGRGATAIAMPGAAMARTKIAGVTAMIDARQALSPLPVGPGLSATQRFAVAAGPADANSATAAMCAFGGEIIPGVPCELVHRAGTVRDDAGPVPDALVDVMLADGDGWSAIDRVRTDDAGHFEADVLASRDVAVRARMDGRDPSAVTPWTDDVRVAIGSVGTITATVLEDLTPIPARLTLSRDGDRRTVDIGPEATKVPLPPGSWDVSITRGYEYEPVHTTVESPGTLEVTLERVVDTIGWMSFDGHVHTEASPDSRVLRADRARNAAAVGLEVVVDSDHEVVADLSPGLDEAGVAPWVATVIGEEVTASSPEHTQAWPLVPDGTVRGGPVDWKGKSLGQIFAAERARGAQVVTLNHPRIGCNYFCLVGWDRVTGEATLDDPAALGLPAEEPLMDWDFDAVEVMNGPRDILLHDDRPDRTGFLDDWLAMINLGHRVTGLGTSDSHDPEDIAWPRTYFASPTDEPAAFDDALLVDAVLAGRAQISAGAFARVSANGADIGELATGADVDLDVLVQAIPEIDVDRIVVLANCDTIADIPATDPDAVVKLDARVAVHLDRDASLVVLGFGTGSMPDGLPDYDPTGVPRVVTNPIYVDVDGNGRFDAPGGKTCAY